MLKSWLVLQTKFKMGVQHLGGFLQNNQSLQRVEDLSNCHLVVDASNLLYTIFHSMDINSSSYGGDLIRFGLDFRLFLENLRQCHIEPIFCLDGSSVGKWSERHENYPKEKEILKRGIERMMQARMARKSSRSHVMPQVARLVMASILDEYKIKRIQAPSEADSIIATVANKYESYVLSGDSDFYIFSIKGFIEMGSFYRQTKCLKYNSKKITSTVFRQDTLKTVIPDLNPEVLPLLAMLVGNDFVENIHLRHVRCSIEFSTQPVDGLEFCTYNHERIGRYLNFLRGKTLNEAVETILNLAHEDHRDSILETISIQVHQYKEDEDDLLRVLNQIYPPKETNPAFYLKRLMEETAGMHNAVVLDIIQSSPFYNYISIDDWRQPSSTCVRYRPYSLAVTLVRPYSYLHLKRDQRLAALAADTFYLFDRFKLGYNKIKFEPIDFLKGFGPVDHLDAYTLVNLDEKVKKNLLLAAFRCPRSVHEALQNILGRVFDKINVLEATTCFMLIRYIGLETKLSPRVEFLNSMLLVLFHHLQKHGTNHELRQIHRIIEEIDCCRNASQEIYRPIVHLISQLQSAYLAFYLLNGLLQYVLPLPRLEIFFNSKLIFRLTEKMISQEVSMNELVQNRTELDHVGRDLVSIVLPSSRLNNKNLCHTASNVTNSQQDNLDRQAWIWYESRD